MEAKEVLNRVKQELRENHYSELTIINYCFFIEKFLLSAHQTLDSLSSNDLLSYLATLQQNKSSSTVALAMASLKFFYTEILKQPFPEFNFQKKEASSTDFLTREEIKKLIITADTRKSKLILSLLYASGLKVSELIHLKPENLNLENKTCTLQKPLGGTRTFLLSKKLNEELKIYLEGYKGIYLFSLHQPLTSRNIQKIVKNTGKRAGIEKKITPHTLRSSFAKHLLEDGVEERVVSILMGYISKQNRFDLNLQEQLLKLKNPYDALEMV